MITASSLAKDLMATDLVTVGPKDPLRDAIGLMMENHISGLPVIDQHDRCVGVLSMTDVLRVESEQAEGGDYEEVGSYYDPDSQRWETIRFSGNVDELPDITVREVMSPDVVSVAPDATLREVATLMLEERVHRVLVLDRKQFLHGLITALDLVQIVAES